MCHCLLCGQHKSPESNPCQSLGLTKAAAEHTQPVRCARHIAVKEQRNERSTARPTASFKHLLDSVGMFPPLMKLMTMLTPQPHSMMQLLRLNGPLPPLLSGDSPKRADARNQTLMYKETGRPLCRGHLKAIGLMKEVSSL